MIRDVEELERRMPLTELPEHFVKISFLKESEGICQNQAKLRDKQTARTHQ